MFSFIVFRIKSCGKPEKSQKLQGMRLWKKMWRKRGLSTEKRGSVLSTKSFSTFHSKNVDNQVVPVLVVILEVMSRITPAILGSVFSSSSTLRMDESTVA